ncbi:hypothetical protein [uncultured Aquimarina sp.]|uniref:hypothetical protein n=1 Tax=uncultured Aquimarina sp. TaxID=575652 RepID=UPI002609A6A4|nr:hypothetical protein [uncultured Aquimarina sp.]
MKLLLFFSSLVSFLGFGQNAIDNIEGIRNEYKEIETLLNKLELEQKEITYTCEGERINGTLIFYYKDHDLRLITHSFDQGHYSTLDSYYIHKTNLFFSLREESVQNDRPVYDKNTGALLAIDEDWSITELRTYISKEKAIKCLSKYYDNKDVTVDIKEKHTDPSAYFENKEILCDIENTKETLNRYAQLIKFQKTDVENICLLH